MSIEKEIIDYEKNKEDISHWVLLKGEYRYEEIIMFLRDKKIECTWKNVTYFIKYDKRLLINSFKYIVFFEELIKSLIWRKKQNGKSKIINLDFKDAISNYLAIEGIDDEIINSKYLKENYETINIFRNSVVHNKVLLGHKFNGKELEDVLNIFKNILPPDYREGFSNDINKSSIGITDKLWHIEI